MKHFLDNKSTKKRLTEIPSGSCVTIKINDQVFGAEIKDAYSTGSPIKLADFFHGAEIEAGSYLLLKMTGNVGLELEIP